jgi:hypothetical protein
VEDVDQDVLGVEVRHCSLCINAVARQLGLFQRDFVRLKPKDEAFNFAVEKQNKNGQLLKLQ